MVFLEHLNCNKVKHEDRVHVVHVKMAFASKYTQKFLIEQSDSLKDCEIEFKSSILRNVFDRKIHTTAKLGISFQQCENLLYFA